MRALMYLHTRSGGHWRYSCELARGLGDHTRMAVVCAGGAEPADGVTTLPVLSPIDEGAHGIARIVDRQLVYGRHLRQLKALLGRDAQESGPGVIHFQEFPTFLGAAAVDVARRAGYRTVVTVHNVQPHETDLLARLRQRDAVAAWARADQLIVHTETLRSQLLQILPSAQVAVVPHPIWPVAPSPEPDQPRDYLFFGVLRENKGILHFLNALAALDNPTATVAGGGSQKMVDDIQRRIEDLGLTRCDFRPGYLADEEVAPLFAAHRVLVAPYQGFAAQSGVTHLAIAHRRPIVVTDIGGLAEPVKKYGVGEIAPDLAEGLALTMHKAGLRQQQHAYEQGFTDALANLSIDAVASATVQVYERANHARSA